MLYDISIPHANNSRFKATQSIKLLNINACDRANLSTNRFLATVEQVAVDFSAPSFDLNALSIDPALAAIDRLSAPFSSVMLH